MSNILSNMPARPSPSGSNLTRSQFLLWLGQRLQPTVPLYNMAFAITLRGPLDQEAFRAAFQRLIDDVDALRIVVTMLDASPHRQVRPRLRYQLPILDLSAQPNPESQAWRWVGEHVAQAFDLDSRLFDSALIKIADDVHLWYLNQHHLITDGWSIALLHGYMAERYQLALQSRLTEALPPPAYEDYAAQEAAFAETETFARCQRYWREKLAAPLEPTDFFGRTVAGTRAATRRVPLSLGSARSEALRKLATNPTLQSFSEHLTLFSLFAAVLLACLHRISGKRTLRLGTPFHNRPDRTRQQVVGLLIEIGALELTIEAGETFASLGRKIQDQSFADLRHAQPGMSSADINGAFDVLLNYINARFPDLPGLDCESKWVHAGHGDANHALRLQVHDFAGRGEFELAFDLNQDVFDSQREQWLLRHFLTVLDWMAEDPARPLGCGSLLSPREWRRLVVEFNDSTAPYPSAATVADLFRAQVAQTPSSPALRLAPTEPASVLFGRSASYQELDCHVRRLAQALVAWGVGPEVIVAVCLERSMEAVVAILAVLEAGGAYLPLDPRLPEMRLRALIKDSGCKVLLTRREIADRLGDLDRRVCRLDVDWGQLPSSSATRPGQQAGPDNLAYLMYTSGSTGVPKGVMVRHQGLANYLCWALQQYCQGGAASFPLYSSLTFDLTVTSLFTPLLCGGQVVIYGDNAVRPGLEVLQVVEDDAVDVLKLTPAHLALLRQTDWQGSRIKCLILGGEDLRSELAHAVHARSGGRLEIYNEYGPTETVVGCMIHRYDPERDRFGSVPIGVPAANTGIYVLDRYGQPTPPGVVGELVVSGDGVARGYLNHPGLTAERFGEDPLRPGARRYHTGDQARWSGQGSIEFLGRSDDQVKIRGVRIELGEIESALMRHPAVAEAIVVAVEADRPAKQRPHCVRCGLPATYPGSGFDEHGVCKACRDFDSYRERVTPYFKSTRELQQILLDARQRRRGDYDCLVLLSGGKDSTYMLYQVVALGAKPLVFSLDNGYLSEVAKSNIRRVTEHLGVELVWGSTPHMREIFADSLARFSNVCNGCFKTIYTLSTSLARERGIGTIVTGLARGQLFETRLTDMYQARVFDAKIIDQRVLEARKAYHRMPDAVSRCLDISVFNDDAIFEEVQFVDFYRYCEVQVDEIYRFLAAETPWLRPGDTGRSTNCLINDVGIYVHQLERGYHNYALPYSWDVRLGHKTLQGALEELDDQIDAERVQAILAEIGYRPKPLRKAGARLNAFVVGDAKVSESELRSYLAELLPSYMLPARIQHLAALPLTANGKIDRASLPEPDATGADCDEDYQAPEGDIQIPVAEICRRVAGLDRISVSHNLFDLGIDSVQAVEIVAGIQDRFDLRVPIPVLLKSPTVADLALAVEEALLEELEALSDEAAAEQYSSQVRSP